MWLALGGLYNYRLKISTYVYICSYYFVYLFVCLFVCLFVDSSLPRPARPHQLHISPTVRRKPMDLDRVPLMGRGYPILSPRKMRVQMIWKNLMLAIPKTGLIPSFHQQHRQQLSVLSFLSTPVTQVCPPQAVYLLLDCLVNHLKHCQTPGWEWCSTLWLCGILRVHYILAVLCVCVCIYMYMHVYFRTSCECVCGVWLCRGVHILCLVCILTNHIVALIITDESETQARITDVYREPLDLDGLESLVLGILRTGKLTIHGTPGGMPHSWVVGLLQCPPKTLLWFLRLYKASSWTVDPYLWVVDLVNWKWLSQ